jgi:hypothetical protein
MRVVFFRGGSGFILRIGALKRRRRQLASLDPVSGQGGVVGVEAISCRVPLMIRRVELPTVAPWAIAAAVAETVNPTGAACTE